ncbi:MAG: hypothetical protein KIS91_12905 [Anaerolineae bacterium]|nr:hypothetical protein [Anaerolineae bacterium]
MTDTTYAAPRELSSIQRWALILGALGIVVGLAALFLSPLQFYRGYLIGWLFWLGIALGSLGLLMVHHQAGGAWTAVARRFMEAATRTLPLLAILVIPIWIGIPYLYPWADPNSVAANALLQHKQPYLNVPFFIARTILYFVIWIGLALALNHWASAEDRVNDPKYHVRMKNLSGIGLVLLVLTVTFAGIDYVMTLQPTWVSSIFGAIVGAGLFVAAVGFLMLNVTMLYDKEPLSDYMSPSILGNYGGFALSIVLIWMYFTFSQFLLMWYANIAEETPWYILRGNGGWQWITLIIIVAGFIVPFVLLLSVDIKRNPRSMAGVALLLVITQFLNMLWLVNPEFSQTLMISWTDLVLTVGIGGLWLAFYLWQLQRRPLLSLSDHRLPPPNTHGHGHGH